MSLKFDIYNSNCFDLAKSMYLKFDLHAEAIEKWYTGLTTITTERDTWLHYMNLSGQYHAYNDAMSVISMDTLETISFDKETLKDHPTTMAAYKSFGKYYNNLIEAYPNNKVLILGIIYDKDIYDIINMEDFSIVGYNKALVEGREHDLITDLNGQLTMFGTNAGCPDYVDVEDLYPTAVLAWVTANLAVMIKRRRLQNSRSYNAHSFYIWSHINTYINLEEYKDYLTESDIIYLFKNVIRLKAGLCTKSIFMEVLTTIVTPKLIMPYYLKSKTDVTTIDYDTLIANAGWVDESIIDDTYRTKQLDDILYEHLERSNYEDSYLEDKIGNYLTRQYNTNDYPELTLYDNREREGDIRENLVEVDYAFLFSGLGLLSSYYELASPVDGEITTLNHSDWLLVYKRLFEIKVNLISEDIPVHVTTQLYNKDGVKASELTALGIHIDTANQILGYMGTFPVIRNDKYLLSDYITNYNNTKSSVVALLSTAYKTTNQLYLDKALSLIFRSYTIDLAGEGVDYSDWLLNKGFDITEMDGDLIDEVLVNILITVMGIPNDEAISTVSKMGGLLGKFVSYKTNITNETSDTITLAVSKRPTWNTEVQLIGPTIQNITSDTQGGIVLIEAPKVNMDIPSTKAAICMPKNIDYLPVSSGGMSLETDKSTYKSFINLSTINVDVTISE